MNNRFADICRRLAPWMSAASDDPNCCAEFREVAAEFAEAVATYTVVREDPDKDAMDWLETKSVEVRVPAAYGSWHMFTAQDLSEEEETYKSDLRSRVKAAMLAEKIAKLRDSKGN